MRCHDVGASGHEMVAYFWLFLVKQMVYRDGDGNVMVEDRLALTHLLCGGIRQVSESPQAVLHQPLAGTRQVLTQGLHAT